MKQTEGSDTVATSGPDADNFATTPPSSMQTGPMLGGEQSATTMPTVEDRQSTARSAHEPGHHFTTGTTGNVSDGRSDGSSRTTATTSAPDSSTGFTTKTSDAEGDGSDPHKTTMNPSASVSELTTTDYGQYLKGIKLNLGLDFDLKDLSEEQKKDLDSISTAYGLNVSELSQY